MHGKIEICRLEAGAPSIWRGAAGLEEDVRKKLIEVALLLEAQRLGLEAYASDLNPQYIGRNAGFQPASYPASLEQ